MPDYEKVLLTKTDSQDDICKAGLPSPDWQKVARVLAEKLTDAKCVGQVDKALCTGKAGLCFLLALLGREGGGAWLK